MNIYNAMRSDEFIGWLREQAEKQKAPPAVFWQLDNLTTVESLEADLETANGETTDAEQERDDLYDELRDLLEAVHKYLPDDAQPEAGSKFDAALRAAAAAVERHK